MLTVAPLAHDPALPRRDDYLDPVRATAAYARSAGIVATPIRLVRSKYRIGESLRVVHRIVVDGRHETVTARMFPDRARADAAFRSAVDRAERAGHHDGVTFDPTAGAVWWRFPADRKIAGAGTILHPTTELATSLGLASWRQSTVAEYAPERSLTVRADGPGGRAVGYVKLYAPGTVDVAEYAARYDAAAARLAACTGSVVVPGVLGCDADLLALAAMPGDHWHQLAPHHLPGVMHDLGGAIAHFHTTPAVADGRPLAGPFGRLRADRVVHSAELVARARPDVASRILRIAERLAAGPPADEAPVLLHGDCHPKNSLVDGERLVLIDLDQAGVGSSAADIASLLARLHHGVITGQHDLATADRLGDAFLEGYRRVGRLPSRDSLRWHLAAALVAERAIRAVNRVHPVALAALPDLVDLTHRALEQP